MKRGEKTRLSSNNPEGKDARIYGIKAMSSGLQEWVRGKGSKSFQCVRSQQRFAHAFPFAPMVINEIKPAFYLLLGKIQHVTAAFNFCMPFFQKIKRIVRSFADKKMSPFYRHVLDPRLVHYVAILTFAVGDTSKARHHIARKPSSKIIIRTNAELYLIVSL